MIKLSEWWKDFKSDSNDNLHNIPLLRKLGFAGVLLVDFIINANFYKSIADVWIMPIAGIILVFMKVWHWVSAQRSPRGRAKLHYFTWGALAMMSILASVSYGVAVTNFTNVDVAEQLALRGIASTATTTQLNSWVDERAALTDTIKKLNDNIASYTGDRADWNKSKAADQASLQLATNRAGELDRLIAEANVKANTAVGTKALVNAQTVFSNIFGNSGTPIAIKIFFVMFGLSIELTLALSSLPLPNKTPTGPPIEESIPSESVQKVITEVLTDFVNKEQESEVKPKRKYTKKAKPKESTLKTGTSSIGVQKESDTTTVVPERAVTQAMEEPEVTEKSDDEAPVREVMSLEERYLRSLYDSAEGLKDRFEAGAQIGLNRIHTQKIWDFLSTTNGPDGEKYVKFRPDNGKWYPCYPLDQIINLIKQKQIQIL